MFQFELLNELHEPRLHENESSTHPRWVSAQNLRTIISNDTGDHGNFDKNISHLKSLSLLNIYAYLNDVSIRNLSWVDFDLDLIHQKLEKYYMLYPNQDMKNLVTKFLSHLDGRSQLLLFVVRDEDFQVIDLSISLESSYNLRTFTCCEQDQVMNVTIQSYLGHFVDNFQYGVVVSPLIAICQWLSQRGNHKVKSLKMLNPLGDLIRNADLDNWQQQLDLIHMWKQLKTQLQITP